MPTTKLPLAQHLGRRVALYRKAAGLTQHALAAEVGLTREYVARIEAGLHAPGLPVLVRIAKALGVTAGGLID